MLHDSLNSNGLCVSLTIFFRENRSYSLLKNAMVISHHHWLHISPGELLKIISHLFIFQYVCIYTPIAKCCSCVSPSHYCLFVSLTSVFIPVHVPHWQFVDVHQSHLVYSAILVSHIFFSPVCQPASSKELRGRQQGQHQGQTTRMTVRMMMRASRSEATAVKPRSPSQQRCNGNDSNDATAW